MPFLASLGAFALAAGAVRAQQGVYTLSNASYSTVYTVTQDTGANIPLFSKRFQWPQLPYQADSGTGPRGTMQGYNICNTSTLGESSKCTTLWMNGPDDFCLWGAPVPNSVVGDVEGEMVAECSSATHGSRVIKPGTIQGMQFITTPYYIEIVGYLDQTKIGLTASDYGGEEDPHGADGRGNALGALMFSSAFGKGIQQVINWNYFVGSGQFCFKACNPNTPDQWNLCNNVYDRTGCTYNMPASYDTINGTFTNCKGDPQLPVGVYTGSDGKTSTWYQPGEDVTNFTPPYSPQIPKSSQCTTLTSAQIFASANQYWSAHPGNLTTSTPSSAAPNATSTAAKLTTIVSNGQTIVTAMPAANAAQITQSGAVTSNKPNSAARGAGFASAGAMLAGVMAFAVFFA